MPPVSAGPAAAPASDSSAARVPTTRWSSEEEKVRILLPFARFPLFRPPGRPSSSPLDPPRNSGQSATQERSGE
eukprot:5184781-Pyramimonas_sp.AAC.1